LIDTATGALLADEVGQKPRFSPTGRFVIAEAEGKFQIHDAIDGKVAQLSAINGGVAQLSNGGAGWADGGWADNVG
jgi:hypothetical protein